MCSCWRLPLAQCSPAGAWIVPGEVPAGSGEGTRSPPHSTTDKFPQSSEHRVKQMGSCDSIFHIIPEKPLTRPQITTLMLFSPLTTPQPSTLPLQNNHPHLPPALADSPSNTLASGGGSLSQAILTQAIAFGEWIPFKVTKTNSKRCTKKERSPVRILLESIAHTAAPSPGPGAAPRSQAAHGSQVQLAIFTYYTGGKRKSHVKLNLGKQKFFQL